MRFARASRLLGCGLWLLAAGAASGQTTRPIDPVHPIHPVDPVDPIRGIAASDALGAEDIWGNPTFVGGVVNGGPTAHSEW